MKDHPLFPGDDDEPSKDIGRIYVTRRDGGRVITMPRQYEPDELTEPSQIWEEYGGGVYELIARTADNKRVATRRIYEFPGQPLPIGTPGGQPATAPMQAHGGGMGDSLLAALVTSQSQMQQNMMTFLGTMMQNQTTTMVAMMGKDSEAARTHTAQMQAMYQSFGQHQTELLTKVLDSKQKGVASVDSLQVFKEGMEFAASAAPDGEGEDTMDQIAKGLELVSKVDNLGDGGANRPANNAGE